MMIRMKKNKSLWKMIKLGVVFIAFLFVAMPVTSRAAEADIAARIEALKIKFPGGKYWNHVGSQTDNENGWTNSPCTCHGKSGVSHVYGTGGCTCNHHADGGHLLATQCMGFANKLGYDVFGNTTWTKYMNPTAAQIANIRIGDIIRMDNDSHSVFVIAKNGNQVTVGEANYTGKCQISWTRTMNLTAVSITYYEHANNYNTITGSGLVDPGTGGAASGSGTTGTQSTQAPTTQTLSTTAATEQPSQSFTGWKKTADGKHYQYYKSGKLQKKKWITLKKKKYYLDKKGYRITGFYNIGGKTYYFNASGVMQKKKWFQVGNDTYYVNEQGLVLKSQWLWYKGSTVYVTEDGSIAKNEIVKISGKSYYFNSKGKRSKGFKKYKGKYYYCNSKGIIQKKKWITKGGKKYYVQKSGVRAQNTLIKIGKYKYYFNEKGCLVKNKRITYKGRIYKANKKGQCKFLKDVVVEEASTELETEKN